MLLIFSILFVRLKIVVYMFLLFSCFLYSFTRSEGSVQRSGEQMVSSVCKLFHNLLSLSNTTLGSLGGCMSVWQNITARRQ